MNQHEHRAAKAEMHAAVPACQNHWCRFGRPKLEAQVDALLAIIKDVDYFDPMGGVIDGHFDLTPEQDTVLRALLVGEYGEEKVARMWSW